MSDDQAPWAWSASDYDEVHTPNMDRIAQEGAILPNAFVDTPVCSPARASLLTSRYGTEVGITDWINHQWDAEWLLHGLEPDHGLDPSYLTWADLLQDAGYTTALIGKWHLGQNPEYHPVQSGYSEFVGFLAGGTDVTDPTLEKDGVDQQFEGFTVDILTDEALDFIRRHRDESFALSLHYRAPHTPWLPLPEKDWAPYRDIDPEIPNPDFPDLDVERLKQMTREYLGSVASVDRNIGRVLTLLKELELEDNTVVIFTSDHGYNMGHNGIWHKGNGHWALNNPPPATENIPRNQRPNMYDNSLKVPLGIRWPGGVDPGTRIEETVTLLDWYPTILSIAGVSIPDTVIVRGRDMSPLLRGESVEDWDNDMFGQYSTHHQSRTHMRSYRTERWKLVRDYLNPERDEFYDLENDPAEQQNQINSSDSEVEQAIVDLDVLLKARMGEIGDPVLELAQTNDE